MSVSAVTEGAEACSDSPCWYAVAVQGRREKLTAKRYSDLGFSTWLPVYRHESKWSDRVAVIERPLIPGYVFLCLPPSQLAQALRAVFVLRVLGDNQHPTPIDHAEISRFRSFIETAKIVRPRTYQPGEEITIRRGALAGQTGFVVKRKNETRIVVSLEIGPVEYRPGKMRRAVSVEIEVATL